MHQLLRDMLAWTTAIADASLRPREHEVIVGEPKPDVYHDQGQMASFAAGTEALLGQWTGDERRFDAAREYLLVPTPVAPFSASAGYTAVTLLRRAGKLSPADEDRVCATMSAAARRNADGFLHRLYGMRRFNHALTTANLCDAVARLWPDAPDTPWLREQAEGVWREWWPLGENVEGAPNYEGFMQVALLEWADRRGELDRMMADPRTGAWIDRGLDHFFPVGIMPGYGDTNTMELWPDWLALWSIVAAWGHDARPRRARWAVERMWEWVAARGWLHNIDILDSRPADGGDWGRSWYQVPRTAWFIASARQILLDGEIAVEPLPPPAGPAVTHRVLPVADHIRNTSWSLRPVAEGPRVPDKVVLRFGPEASGPQAMIGCSRQFWHDHMDSGAIIAYAASGIVRLDDHGYFQKLPEFHNLFWVARSEGEWLANASGEWERRRAKVGSFGPADAQVRGLTGDRVAQMAVLACEAPHGLPISHERTILLSRRGPMVVWDRVVPYAGGLVGSPLWHAESVRRSGDGWAEISIDTFQGVNGPAMANAPATLLLVDPLAGGPWERMTQENVDFFGPLNPGMSHPLWTRSYTTRECLFRRMPLVAGDETRFITALVPGESVADPSVAAWLIGRHGSTGLAIDVAGSLLAIDDATEAIGGDWGASDAAVLWVESAGIFAHRARTVVIRRTGLPPFAISSDPMYIDLDLAIEDGVLRGLVASEKASTVRIALGGRTVEFVSRGITPVEMAL